MKRIIPYIKRLISKQPILYIQIEHSTFIVATLHSHLGSWYKVNNISYYNLDKHDLYDNIVFNSSKIANIINLYINKYCLSKPQAILCAPYLNNKNSTNNLLNTMNTTLIFTRCNAQLKRVVNKALINKERKPSKNSKFKLNFLLNQPDILAPFKHYNQHHPLSWIITTCIMITFTTWFLYDISIKQYTSHSQLKQKISTIQASSKPQQGSAQIAALKIEIDKLKKKAQYAQPSNHYLKPENILHAISQAIPLKTYLTYLSIQQDDQAPTRYDLQMSGISLEPEQPSLFVQKLNRMGIIKHLGLKRIKKKKGESSTKNKGKLYIFETHGTLFS